MHHVQMEMANTEIDYTEIQSSKDLAPFLDPDDKVSKFLKRWGTGMLATPLVERVVKKFGASLAFCRTSRLFRQRRRQRRNPLIFRLLRVCPESEA
jgi:hypothetical protein